MLVLIPWVLVASLTSLHNHVLIRSLSVSSCLDREAVSLMCRSVPNTKEETSHSPSLHSPRRVEASLHSPLFRPLQVPPPTSQPPLASELLGHNGATAYQIELKDGSPLKGHSIRPGGGELERTDPQIERGKSRETSSLLQKAQAKLESLRNKFQKTLREPPCPQIPAIERRAHQNGVVPPLNLTALTSGKPFEATVQGQSSREGLQQGLGPRLVEGATMATSSAPQAPANGKSSVELSRATPAAGTTIPPFISPRQLQYAAAAHQGVSSAVAVATGPPKLLGEQRGFGEQRDARRSRLARLKITRLYCPTSRDTLPLHSLALPRSCCSP